MQAADRLCCICASCMWLASKARTFDTSGLRRIDQHDVDFNGVFTVRILCLQSSSDRLRSRRAWTTFNHHSSCRWLMCHRGWQRESWYRRFTFRPYLTGVGRIIIIIIIITREKNVGSPSQDKDGRAHSHMGALIIQRNWARCFWGEGETARFIQDVAQLEILSPQHQHTH